jgi:peroxiredoxin
MSFTLQLGQKAPDFKLVATDGKTYTLADHLAGRPVRAPLTNPIGCNVKWDGQDAHWMPGEACDLV